MTRSVAVTLAALLAAAAGWVAVIAVNLGRPCGGDGDSAYAAAGSAAHAFCHDGGQPALAVVPLVGVALGALYARRRDPGEATWWIGVGLLAGAVAAAIIVVLARRLALTP